MTETEATALTIQYGYRARKVPLGYCIERKYPHGLYGCTAALVTSKGKIVSYADDYGAQDHLAASALAGAIRMEEC